MFINVWTLNNNVMNNPRVFNPTRHSPESTVQENHGIDPNSSKRPHFTFGAGRCVCPGFHVAERGLFTAILTMMRRGETNISLGPLLSPVIKAVQRSFVRPGRRRAHLMRMEILPRSSSRESLFPRRRNPDGLL